MQSITFPVRCVNEVYVSQATLTKEEMFKLCHFVHHTLLMSTLQFITINRKAALFHKAFYPLSFFFFQIEAFVVVSICLPII